MIDPTTHTGFISLLFKIYSFLSKNFRAAWPLHYGDNFPAKFYFISKSEWGVIILKKGMELIVKE